MTVAKEGCHDYGHLRRSGGLVSGGETLVGSGDFEDEVSQKLKPCYCAHTCVLCNICTIKST